MPDEPRKITIRAHAKVNLSLAVDQPIQHGEHARMHPIKSWMAPITLHDRVTIEMSPGGSRFSIVWATDRGEPRAVEWPIESDLAFRAHAMLERAFGPMPVRVEIEKHIPAGGGLGGGSADAAAVLRGLNALFALGLSTTQLRGFAAKLGSDIPFFIPDEPERSDSDLSSFAFRPPEPAIVGGLGDLVEPAAITDVGLYPLLLIIPPFGCPTGEVYRAFDDAPSAAFREAEVVAMARSGEIVPRELFNDLGPASIAVRPALGAMKDDLERGLGRPVHVSGSGSTLFCVGGAPELAREIVPVDTGVITSMLVSS